MEVQAILLLTTALGGTTCPKDTFLQQLEGNSSKCCEMCPPGHYVHLPCTAVQATDCKPCKPLTYMDTKTDKRKCKACTLTKCTPPRVVLQACNATHNTMCVCPEGHFFHSGRFVCSICSTCKKGNGVKRNCSTNEDTVCHPCPLGETFSSTESDKEDCQPCIQCKINQVVSRICTPEKDGQCVNVTDTNGTANTRNPAQDLDSSPTAVIAKRNAAKLKTVPVIASAAALLLIFIVLGVVCWRRCCRANSLANNNNGRGNANEVEERGAIALLPIPPANQVNMPQETLSRARSSRGLRGRKSHRHCNSTKAGSHNSDGSSSGSSCSLQGASEGESTNETFFVRDLPYDIIDGIANLLNPKGRNNWTRLAGRLGYTQVDVGLFGVDPCESTQSLLRDWATRESSTVENLHKHLLEIKRHDAARLLEAH